MMKDDEGGVWKILGGSWLVLVVFFFRMIFCTGGSFHDHLSLSEDEPSLYIFSRVLQATG